MRQLRTTDVLAKVPMVRTEATSNGRRGVVGWLGDSRSS
jgi:hypothetical protein